jgi:hypothetical protein
MNNEKRELTKISNNQYELKITKQEGKIVTIAKYDKSQMKENAETVKRTLNVAMARKQQMEQQLKKLDVEDNQELRDMIELIKKAQQLEGKTKIEFDLKNLLKEIKDINMQHKEIKKVCPEFFRGKQ